MPEPASAARRVLMVAYYFPPLGGIGSLRALKFAQYLPEFGWEPTVLAPINGAYHRDPSLTFPEERVRRSLSLEISRSGKRLIRPAPDDTRALKVGPITRRLRDWVRAHVYRPDGQIGWYPFALLSGQRALREQRFDAIFSSSFPVTAHLVARQLARENDLPWVAEFRDPFAGAMSASDPGSAWAHQLEAAMLRQAAAVVVPSPDWGADMARRGARQVVVITNGFDPVDFGPESSSAALVLGHLGSFMPDRQDLTTVPSALAQLTRSAASGLARLKIVGEPQPEVIMRIKAAFPEAEIEVTGFRPHRQALAALTASSVLWIAGTHRAEPHLAGWIPAKIFECLGTGLPIVYVGRLDSDAARLLEGQPGCFLARDGDVDGTREALMRAAAHGRTRRQLDAWTRRSLTRTLAIVLGDAVGAAR